jgi:hypothetical protein
VLELVRHGLKVRDIAALLGVHERVVAPMFERVTITSRERKHG